MEQALKKPAGIIFDLGGVLLEFDHMITCRELSKRSSKTPEEIYEIIFKGGLEARYDMGLPSDDFLKKINELLGSHLNIHEFGDIWGDIFIENKAVSRGILNNLKGRARLFLLSNTNELHYEFVKRHYPWITGSFEREFLSYELGLRKPSPEIFLKSIELSGLKPDELFYIDDRVENAVAAQNAGIRSAHFRSAKELADELEKLGFSLAPAFTN